MSHPRTLLALSLAAASALVVGAVPANAAPTTGAPTTGAFRITPSLVLGLPMAGGCTWTPEDPKPVAVLAMQRIDWMWAPIALDGAPLSSDEPLGTPLAKVLIPNTIEPAGLGIRQRHDLAEGEHFTAPGPKRENPTTCNFAGVTEEGPFTLTITGIVVTIPKWLDALQPPIQAPKLG